MQGHHFLLCCCLFGYDRVGCSTFVKLRPSLGQKFRVYQASDLPPNFPRRVSPTCMAAPFFDIEVIELTLVEIQSAFLCLELSNLPRWCREPLMQLRQFPVAAVLKVKLLVEQIVQLLVEILVSVKVLTRLEEQVVRFIKHY